MCSVEAENIFHLIFIGWRHEKQIEKTCLDNQRDIGT